MIKNFVRNISKSNIIAFLVLVAALSVSGFATFYIYDFASDSIDDLTLKLMIDVSNTIETKIENFVDSIVIPLSVIKRAAENVYFNISHSNIQDVPYAMEYMNHILATTSLTGIFYVDVYGTDIGYLRTDGIIAAFFMFRNITKQAGIYLCDEKGRFNWTTDAPIAEIEGLTDVTYWDPFFKARQSGVTVWSDPFSASGFDDIIYARVDPLYWKGTGELFGGIGINVGVRAWSNFLASIHLTKNSKIYIMDSRGILLADAEATKTNTSAFIFTTLSPGTNSSDLIIAASAQHLETKYGKIDRIPSEAHLHAFIYDGEKHFALTSRIDIAPTLKLVVVIVLPQGDVSGSILSIRTMVIALTLVALIFGTIKHIPINWAYKTLKSLNNIEINQETSEEFRDEM